MDNKNRENSPQQRKAASIQASEMSESLLSKLDKLELELEKMRNQAPPDTPPPLRPDKLDAYEETLKGVALKLDSLLADLLEAEVMGYTYPDFLPLDETGLILKNTAVGQDRGREKQSRSVQEILVIATLIAAVFLVGMTFGLWGSFFFGL